MIVLVAVCINVVRTGDVIGRLDDEKINMETSTGA